MSSLERPIAVKKEITKNTGIISLGTNLSRVLGLLRDILIAKFFGTTYHAASFIVAFTIPNMMRDFVGEGACNAAFVPVLTEYRVKKDEHEFWKAANVILNLLGIALVGISILGILFAPVIVRLMAPGFIKNPEAIALTVRLTRVIFPYILFIGLAAYGMGVLNTLKHFAAPAFGPALLNVSLIVCALFLCPKIGVMGLAFGVLIGGVLQVAVQIPVLRKKGFKRTEKFSLIHPAAKKIALLLVPRIMGTGVYQINVLADRMLASLFWIVGQGGIPALYYSYRLIQYPLAVFSTALATASLPAMSRQVVEGNMDDFKKTISFSLKSIFYVMIPASVGLAIIGKPIIQILFQRGLFDIYSSSITYRALLFYCVGLFAYGGIRILATSFYSMNDTRTPVKVAAISLVVNIVFNLLLMWPLKVGGLALATSIAGMSNFTILFIILRKRLGDLEEKSMLLFAGKIVSASAFMGLISYLLTNKLMSAMGSHGGLFNIAFLLSIIIISISAYLLATFILRMEEPRKLLKWILRKS